MTPKQIQLFRFLQFVAIQVNEGLLVLVMASVYLKKILASDLQITNDHPKLVAAVCVLIATKFLQRQRGLTAKHMVGFLENKYSVAHIAAAEFCVSQTLSFKFHLPTWFESLAKVAKTLPSLPLFARPLVLVLCELSMFSKRLSNIHPDLIAEASILCAVMMLGEFSTCLKDYEQYFHISRVFGSRHPYSIKKFITTAYKLTTTPQKFKYLSVVSQILLKTASSSMGDKTQLMCTFHLDDVCFEKIKHVIMEGDKKLAIVESSLEVVMSGPQDQILGSNLTRGDMSCLLAGNDLTPLVVDKCMTILSEKANNDVKYMSSLSLERPQAPLKKRHRIDWSAASKILVPIQNTCMCWILMVIDTSDQVVICFKRDGDVHTFDIIRNALAISCPNIKDWTYLICNFDDSIDRHDTGVTAILYAEQMLNNSAMKPWEVSVLPISVFGRASLIKMLMS